MTKQLRDSSIDEFSCVVAREVSTTLGQTDEFALIVSLSTVARGFNNGTEISAESLVKMTLRMFISILMHKMTLTLWPAVAFALHIPADLIQ